MSDLHGSRDMRPKISLHASFLCVLQHAMPKTMLAVLEVTPSSSAFLDLPCSPLWPMSETTWTGESVSHCDLAYLAILQ